MLLIEPGGAGRGGRSAKCAGDGMGALVAVIAEADGAEAEGYPRPDVIAKGDRAEKTGAIDGESLAGGDGGGDNGAARVGSGPW